MVHKILGVCDIEEVNGGDDGQGKVLPLGVEGGSGDQDHVGEDHSIKQALAERDETSAHDQEDQAEEPEDSVAPFVSTD